MRRWAAAAIWLSLCVGCQSTEHGDGRADLRRHVRNLAPLSTVDGNETLGVAVRVSTEQVFFALAPGAEGPSRTLTVGELTAVAKPLGEPGNTLLAVRRKGTDFRPCLPARPGKGERLVAFSVRQGAISAWQLATPDEVPPAGPVPVTPPLWLRLTADDDAIEQAPEPDASLSGSPVFTHAGAWAGFLEERSGGWLVHGPRPDQLLRTALDSGGADVLGPSDLGKLLTLRVTEVAAVPNVSDEWGDPDFFLRLRVRGRPLDPIPLDALEHRTRLPLDAENLEVELVERDVSLTAGDHSERVAGPMALVPFGFSQKLVLPTPNGEPVVFTCEARFADPEGESGDDRTPLGARNLPIRRVAGGSVSAAGSDATDLWRFEAPTTAPYLVVVLRDSSEGALDVSIHGPSLHETYLRGRLIEGRLLRILPTVAPISPGPALLRVRQLRGERPANYSLVVARRDDPLSLVRTLFRVVSRAAPDQPYLDTREFAREVYESLALDAKLERQAVTRAILAELGHRSRAGRHLALRLLERTFRPETESLENVYTGSDGIRSLDAGLLLALRNPNNSSYTKVIELAARDADPLVRLLGLAVASAFTTPERRSSLRALFADDPSAQIQRVLGRTR